MKRIGWLVFLAACGGDLGGEGKLDPGYTECGGTTCPPGQYCFGGGICENGCVSDANCLPEDECVIDDDFFDEGQCHPRDGEPEPTTAPEDPLEACRAACEDFQSCGMNPADTAACKNDCATLTETQQEVIGDCGGLSCDDALTCLGVECFGDGDCSGGTSCVGYVCL